MSLSDSLLNRFSKSFSSGEYIKMRFIETRDSIFAFESRFVRVSSILPFLSRHATLLSVV